MQTNIINNTKPIDKTEYEMLIKTIEKYDRIYLFRHVNPDGDALGSQFPVYEFIKSTYKDKKVFVVGNPSDTNIKEFFDQSILLNGKAQVDEMVNAKDALAISFDTSALARIDGSELYMACKERVKFDHHPNIEDFETIKIQSSGYIAATEMVAEMFYLLNLKITKQQAIQMYLGIVTDSGRFQYPGTSARTMRLAAYLMEQGIEPQKDILLKLYTRSQNDIVFGGYVLKTATFDKGVISCFVDEEEAFKLGINRDQIGLSVSMFQGIENYSYVVFGFFDKELKSWRLSLRSNAKPINTIAEKYGGGGHAFASGIKTDDDSVKDKVRVALEELVNG